MSLILAWTAAALSLGALCFLARRHKADRESADEKVKRLENLQSGVQRHVDRLEKLVEALPDIFKWSLASPGSRRREDVSKTVLQNACQILGLSKGSLMLLDRTGGLRMAGMQGLPDSAASAALKLGEGVPGRVAETGEALHVADMRHDRRFLREPGHPWESESMACVALRGRSGVLGVLTMNAEPGRTLEEREVRLLQIMADHAALLFENLKLYDGLQGFYLETIETLARALGARNGESAERWERARFFARRVAQELRLPEPLADSIEYAALMHDLGKIGLDHAVLQKPGKLTDEEYAKIKEYPQRGFRLLESLEFFAPVAPMILHHREWYNGQGYPEGLMGEEIPLGARIVALIDAWDAMTSDRPYRKALSREAAVQEITRGAGTQFDPQVVKAFLAVLESPDDRPVS
jgi:hypothetical protein